MIRTLIVDDDSLIHVTLRSMLNWERYGFTVVQDCSNGIQALNYMKDHTVDLLITDMKIPGMSGIELMQELRQQTYMPVTVVLSGYDEFDLVREAFRLGAYDYLLKSSLNYTSLERLLSGLKKSVFRGMTGTEQEKDRTQGQELVSGDYIVASFRVHNFGQAAQRFGDNLKEKMEKPMLELVNQIQRLQGRAIFRAKDPAYYEMFYQVKDWNKGRDMVLSAVSQIQGIWRDFMNLEVAVGISDMVPLEKVEEARKQCAVLCKLTVLQGMGKVCTQWKHGMLALEYEAAGGNCDALIASLCGEDEVLLQREMGLWFSSLKRLDDRTHCRRILVMMARLGDRLRHYGQSYFAVFPDISDIPQILRDFDTRAERELWLRNTLRRVQVACEENRKQKKLGVMDRAKKFMQDNFNNPELTLKTVADYVGFNEKYFSTRFTKECGCTFISYLNELRIRRAQELLLQTDMKMYEISEAVGYSSVEHFNQRFKKKLCISPSEFRQNQKYS